MAVNAPPRAGIRAFSGGPFGIGFAPWLIGAAALAGAIFLFVRRGGGTRGAVQGQAGAQPGSMPLTSQPSINVFPYPTGAQGSVGSNISAGQLDGQGTSIMPAPAVPPTPAPPLPSQPVGTVPGALASPLTPTFWRDPLSGAIFMVNAQGKRLLSAAQWASIQQSYGGNAPYTNVDISQLQALPNAA